MSALSPIHNYSRETSVFSFPQCSMINLPPEILGEIFTAYISLPSSTACWEDSNVLSSVRGDSPMILGQICSYWRRVALSMPLLWSSIYIECPMPDHVELIRTWLDRAGTCSLDLCLRDWLDSSNRGCSEGTEAILKIFVEKSRSWRSIDLVIELRESSILDELEWDSCPNLETAALSARYWNQETLDTLWAKVHRSPSLRQVNWYRCFQNGLPSHTPWAQLRHIRTLNELSDADIIFLLRACPNLRSLDTRYTASLSGRLNSSSIVSHSDLESLFLNVVSHSTPLFDHISLPSLRTLRLTNECSSDPLDIDETIGRPVEGCLRRSACSLRVLEVFHFDRGNDLTQFLQSILYVPATRDLSRFDLYPLRSDACEHDMLAKHPSQCVRECASAMENDRCVPDVNPFLLLDKDSVDEDSIKIEWDLLSPLPENDHTTFTHHHLTQLHFDD
ncbi:hypothetical protein AGABI2DRAFT_191005 [Agaricus bisporus var. bisporus H97]|uniref:hypothetical protein n=1 Tax=Agaricus bisporus var. bisporus (strain H97 / ATCC MYA-4626 / FGSC 10389) TaxID=936046 RepID=UPI00029F680F|nr:hypothetical protein AGABI2DRAFT_191005 [Agaricus bisporus var. bisporus H97]EKV48775.1 hypothetical protein AGABI2DRAFT_191005 [Agaricus bisporus var. bisporus H97]